MSPGHSLRGTPTLTTPKECPQGLAASCQDRADSRLSRISWGSGGLGSCDRDPPEWLPDWGLPRGGGGGGERGWERDSKSVERVWV